MENKHELIIINIMYVEDTPDYRDPRSCAEQRRVESAVCQPSAYTYYGVWRLASCVRAFKSLCMQHLLADKWSYTVLIPIAPNNEHSYIDIS
jgi:hypothetical protein